MEYIDHDQEIERRAHPENFEPINDYYDDEVDNPAEFEQEKLDEEPIDNSAGQSTTAIDQASL
jgi:hypothetical protein